MFFLNQMKLRLFVDLVSFKTELLRMHCSTLCEVIVLTSNRLLKPGWECCVSIYHTSFIRPQFPPGSVFVSSSWTFGCARSAFCQTRIKILTLAAVSGTFVQIVPIKALPAVPDRAPVTQLSVSWPSSCPLDWTSNAENLICKHGFSSQLSVHIYTSI